MCLLFFILRIYSYLNSCVKLRSKAAYYAEVLTSSPETANKIIPYEMLSEKYQNKISSEEYNNANEPQELLDLYSNSIFQYYSKRNVDIALSTEGYKKSPEGYFKVENQWYYIKHEIDVSPNFFTLEPKVVRWYIEISETELPKSIQHLYE